ncbi:crotonase [Alicyclobacillus cellulosilyticus]|uniref:Crotonase n=1 Tax=Alicyclobacillus cellulosilyticus TaxID=1003997 RepID=A0A917NI68_9BACL|nr:enoyl-CoA hydratase-related protein [Alicyclobacillus cellulosilyticus]GGJ02528.1 crotonase [Alicyclobacillus cellulosilyticus]
MADTAKADTSWVVVERQGPVAKVVLNRPQQLNALSQALLAQLAAALDELAHDPSVRVVLIRGAGRAFAAGADIAEMAGLAPEQAAELAARGQAVFARLERMRQPVIALVHGWALGGGMELAMACDLRIAAESARFGQPEVTLGILPGFGGTQRLPRLVGLGRAMALLLRGEPVTAAEALTMGLVNEVVPDDALEEAGMRWAERLAALSGPALAAIKRAVYEGWAGGRDGFALEAALFGDLFSTPERRAAMAAFLAKRNAPADRGQGQAGS